jgi:hypothetical protein
MAWAAPWALAVVYPGAPAATARPHTSPQLFEKWSEATRPVLGRGHERPGDEASLYPAPEDRPVKSFTGD